jgi:5'-deoxynucleotidase YfbR-like HD superfamily hydrolase
MPVTANIPLNLVETPSGGWVDVEHPDPATLTLEDIAHKLAQTNRYGGSSAYPYSVAQHAVFVSERIKRIGGSRRQQLLALHHDDPEAFLGDIPKPWKAALGEPYRRLTKRMEAAMWEALGIQPPTEDEHHIIKAADNFALLVEARHLLPSGGHRWDYLAELQADGAPKRIVTPSYWYGSIGWEWARRVYLMRHKELTDGD